MEEGLRTLLGLQGDECGAETGKREGEGTGEKKGETWKGMCAAWFLSNGTTGPDPDRDPGLFLRTGSFLEGR